ncbi:MAG: cytochrome b [Reyranella sp.]|uniref:cytochrome b n=1 Tax=Reyranella sp. TaxID=1929291 RepID=UPI001202472E|nr:cytochrome b [Reyranella sp.]TAJ42015.1 MAG: cytochrome b [Reyranella sp.]
MAAPTYHATAKALHWLTALAVFGLLGVGLWMTGLPISLLKLQVYAWHKWIGLVVLVLTAARLLWRWRHPPPPLPDAVTRWERALAPVGHWALLILLVAMPASGWLMSSAAGVSVSWFGVLPLPDLVPRNPDLFEALRTVHFVLSRCLIVVVALHVAAVLHHDVLRRDGIFRRMWPSGRN